MRLFIGLVLGRRTFGNMATAQEENLQFGDWKVLKIVDPFEDTSRGIASFVDDDNMIVVKCDKPGPQSMYAVIYFRDYIGKGRYGTRDVTFRFDSDEPFVERWSHDKRYVAQFNKERASEFAKKLVSSKKLAVRAHKYDFSSVTKIFEWSSGSREAISEAYKTCGATDPGFLGTP